MDRLRNDKYGKGEHCIDMEEASAPDSTELVRRLLEKFRSPDYQPPLLPKSAIDLLELSRKPNVDFKAIIALLEKESLIAGKVLRIAQSPLYASTVPIRSLQDALVRLGLKTLSQIFLEVSMNVKVFRAKGYQEPMDRLRRHSTATAYIARIVCRYTSLADEYAFMCGLLHDAGIAASMIVLGEGHGGSPREFQDVWPAIEKAHEQAVGVLAGLWKLPEDIKLVLAHHHSFVIDGYAHPLAAALCVSDWIANLLEVGFETPDPANAQNAWKAVGLQQKVLDLIRDEAAKIVPHIQ